MRETDIAVRRGRRVPARRISTAVAFAIGIMFGVPGVAAAATQLATPPAPSISQLSSTSINGTFTPDPLATSSTINLYSGLAFVSTQSVNSSATTFTFTGLITGDTYTATVTSVGDGSNYLDSSEGPASAPVTLVVPQLATPAPPTISETSATSITVTFTKDPNASSSTITLNDLTSSTSATQSGITTGTTLFTALNVGDTYDATVTSVGDNTNYLTSSPSAASSSVTLVLTPLPKPAAPTLSQTTTTSITVTFTPDPNSVSSTVTLTNTTTSTTTSKSSTSGTALFSSLTPSDTYSATITSIGNGTTYSNSPVGAPSAPLTLTVPQLVKPAAPTLSQTTTTSITVTFTPNPNALSSTVTLTNTTTSASTSKSSTTGTALFSNLTPNDTYSATITSIGDGVNFTSSPVGTASTALTLTVPQLAAPAAPTLSQVTPTSIKVTFTPNPNAVSSTITLHDVTANSTTPMSGITTGTFTFSGLTTGDTFSATITSIGDGTNFASSIAGASSSPLSLALLPLGTPEVSVTTMTNTSVTVTFASVQNASSYTAVVYNGTTVVATNSTTCLPAACEVSGLGLDTPYTVIVTANGDHVTYNSSGPSTPVPFVTTSVGPTNAPLPSGVASSSVGAPVSATVSAAAPTTVTLSTTSTTSSVTVPLAALAPGTTVSVYPITSITALASQVPANHSYVVAVVVSWQTAAGTSPDATSPLTLTINDVSIAKGDTIYVLTPTGMVAAGTASVSGTVTVTFTSDPVFVVAAIAKSAQSPLLVNPARVPVSHSVKLSTIGGSGSGRVTFSVTDGTAKGCTFVSPLILKASTYGTCIVTAIKAADSAYGAVSSVAATIKFTALAQASLRIARATGTVGKPVALSASGGSGKGRLTFHVVNGTATGCSIAHSTTFTLRASSAGTCLVVARKSGDATHSATASSRVSIRFLRPKVVAKPHVAAVGAHVKGGVNSSVVLTGTGLKGATVSTTTKGIAVHVVRSTPTSITLSLRVAKSVRSGIYHLTVASKSGTTTTTFRIVATPAVNVDALITSLFAGYRAAWTISPTAGIVYAFQHDYPGSATSANAFLACYQKANVAQTGETDTPVLSTLRPTPTWRDAGPNTQAWNFAGRKPSGTTYSLADVEESVYSSGSPSHVTANVHVTILNGVAYFYFVPAC